MPSGQARRRGAHVSASQAPRLCPSPGRASETGHDAGYWAVRPPEALLRSSEIPSLEISLRQGHRTAAQNRVAPDASDACPPVSCHSPLSVLESLYALDLAPTAHQHPSCQGHQHPPRHRLQWTSFNPWGPAHVLCLERHLSVALGYHTSTCTSPAISVLVPLPPPVSSCCFPGFAPRSRFSVHIPSPTGVAFTH